MSGGAIEVKAAGIFMLDGKGGTMHAPFAMTEDEVVRFLRIRSNKPSTTIAYYRERGKLKGHRVGDKFVYLLEDAIDFLRNQTLESI